RPEAEGDGRRYVEDAPVDRSSGMRCQCPDDHEDDQKVARVQKECAGDEGSYAAEDEWVLGRQLERHEQGERGGYEDLRRQPDREDEYEGAAGEEHDDRPGPRR